MKQEKKDGNYALNTIKDIWKYDPARLLDLGNLAQVLVSQNKPEVNEEARATSNFEKLTEDKRRPIKHTLADAARLLPDLITLAAGPGYAAIKQTVTKNSAKKLGKGVAEKLVKETSSEAADAFSKSLFLPKGLKDKAGKKWVRELYENEEAMKRIAGRDLKTDEIKAIRNALPDSIKKKIDAQNVELSDVASDRYQIMLELQHMKDYDLGFGDTYYINKFRDIDPSARRKVKAFEDLVIKNGLDDAEKLAEYRNFIAHNTDVDRDGVQRIIDNLDAVPIGHRSDTTSEYVADSILRDIPKQKIDKMTKLKEVGKDTFNPVHTAFIGADVVDKAASGLGKNARELITRNNGLEMKPDYWTRGSEPTPVSDFIASIFNVDFDDPTRFNKKDIDTFFEFLEDVGTIEPGIKDKWTPRQKVSVMREMLSDKDYGPYIKEEWAKSKYRESLK